MRGLATPLKPLCGGEGGRPPGPGGSVDLRFARLRLRLDLEDVRLDVDARVELDHAGESRAVGDAVPLLDVAQCRVVRVEEPVAVAQRLELALPHRALQLPEVAA